MSARVELCGQSIRYGVHRGKLVCTCLHEQASVNCWLFLHIYAISSLRSRPSLRCSRLGVIINGSACLFRLDILLPWRVWDTVSFSRERSDDTLGSLSDTCNCTLGVVTQELWLCDRELRQEKTGTNAPSTAASYTFLFLFVGRLSIAECLRRVPWRGCSCKLSMFRERCSWKQDVPGSHVNQISSTVIN